MLKKGVSSHVDWAISIGLFVTYILLMLIFFRPGTQQSYSQATLLDMVKTSLDSEAKYVMEKTPLFIRPEPNNFQATGDYQASIEEVNLPFEGRESNPTHFALVYTNNLILPFHIDLGSGDHQDNLRFNSTFNGPSINYTFFLINSNETTYSNNLVLGDTNKMIFYKYTQNPNQRIINFTYEFGVVEMLTGFSYSKLNSLGSYASLKTKWKFPYDKDFSIVITEVKTGRIVNVNNEAVPSESNVFATYYSDWILQNNSNTDPVNVTIKIW